MEAPRVIWLPVTLVAADHALADVVSAIELVTSGAARRVILAGIPGVEYVAAEALVYAQAAKVRFRLERPPSTPPAVIVGPIEA